jgi:hypothetical protein
MTSKLVLSLQQFEERCRDINGAISELCQSCNKVCPEPCPRSVDVHSVLVNYVDLYKLLSEWPLELERLFEEVQEWEDHLRTRVAASLAMCLALEQQLHNWEMN